MKCFFSILILCSSFFMFSQQKKENSNIFSVLYQTGIGISEINQNNSNYHGFSKRDAVHINYNFKKGLRIITGIGFNSFNANNTTVKEISYIDIPIKIGFNMSFDKDSISKVNLLASLGLKYNVFSNIVYENQKIEFKSNNLSFIGDLGVNFPLSNKLFLNLFFSFSNDIMSAELVNKNDFKIKNDKKVNISIGYSF